MINRELINPQSIVVVGGSNNVHKPGGRLVRNLVDGKYKGELYVVNAKEDDVQGLKSYHSVHDIPETELAIISIPGPACPEVVDVLAKQKNVKAFIVISAGFGEETPEGAVLEERMLIDRPELYRCDEHALSWCFYPADSRISCRWGRFHFQFWWYGAFHYRIGVDKRTSFFFSLVCR